MHLQLHGDLAHEIGPMEKTKIELSLSYTDDQVIAIAVRDLR